MSEGGTLEKILSYRASAMDNVNDSMSYSSAWSVGKPFQMLSIFSLKKSLILEAILFNIYDFIATKS